MICYGLCEEEHQQSKVKIKRRSTHKFKFSINFCNYLFAFCSSFQLHRIQSFLLCLAHRKNISGWLRKSIYRSRSTRPERRRQCRLPGGPCRAAERSIQQYSSRETGTGCETICQTGSREQGHEGIHSVLTFSFVVFFSPIPLMSHLFLSFESKLGSLEKKKTGLLFICMSFFPEYMYVSLVPLGVIFFFSGAIHDYNCQEIVPFH